MRNFYTNIFCSNKKVLYLCYVNITQRKLWIFIGKQTDGGSYFGIQH